MRTPGLLGTLAILLSLGASPVAAQHAQTREGFWIGAGMGVGSLGCEGCGDRTNGASGYVKLGGTLNPHLLLGVETNGWYKSESGVSVSQGSLAGAAYWYPSLTSGFFAKGGVGYARLHADAGIGGSASSNGFGILAGLGYDLRVGGNTSITPVANWFRGTFDGGSSDVFQLGVGVTLH
jgi:hypothetical protein